MDFRAPVGRITRYEVADFVRDYYVSLSETELDAIIRRCDTDEDEAMNFSEFSEVVGVARSIAWPSTAATVVIDPLYRSIYDPYLWSYVYDPYYYPYYYRDTLRSSPVRTTSLYYSPVWRTYSPIRSYRETSPVRHTYVSPYRSRVETFVSPSRTVERFTPARTVERSSPLWQKSPARATKTKRSSPIRTAPRTASSPVRHSKLEEEKQSPFRNTLRPYEEEEFVEAMKELISLEHELEISKQNLALRTDFNLYDAFKIFDPTNYG